MGLMKKVSGGNYKPKTVVTPPNPDPKHFKITKWEQIGPHLVACIKYPGCTTYEGNKILVFEETRLEDLAGCSLIDPHFSDNAPKTTRVPVARFEPTVRGWNLARVTAAALELVK
jgi:hypothetical protein